MRVMVVAGLVACGPGIPKVDTRSVGREALVKSSGDPDAIAALLRAPVTNGGVYFEDPACAFPEGEIAAERLPAFARCLAALHLQPSTRQDALGDVVVMTYGPGFELEVRVVEELSGPRVTWIGLVSRRDLADNLPTITADALEAHRLTGTRDGPLEPGAASELARDASPNHPGVYAWIKLCIDGTGKVIAAHPHETTSARASNVFSDAATTWTFRPFVVRDRALPVCALVRMASPPGTAPAVETIPMPPPPSRQGKPPAIVFAEGAKLAEGHRIRGERMIVPDDATKKAMKRRRISNIEGRFRICLDDTGKVESVLPMQSTGFAGYDRRIVATLWSWVYAPYRIDDQPVPVCTAVTFIYRQR